MTYFQETPCKRNRIERWFREMNIRMTYFQETPCKRNRIERWFREMK